MSSTIQLTAVTAPHVVRIVIAATIRGRAEPRDGLHWVLFSYAVSTEVKLRAMAMAIEQ
jgi:hypothetical protein